MRGFPRKKNNSKIINSVYLMMQTWKYETIFRIDWLFYCYFISENGIAAGFYACWKQQQQNWYGIFCSVFKYEITFLFHFRETIFFSNKRFGLQMVRLCVCSAYIRHLCYHIMKSTMYIRSNLIKSR